MRVEIYADGSVVTGNGRPGVMGFAAVTLHKKRTRKFAGRQEAHRATSNHAELLAIHLGLQKVKPELRAQIEILVYSDSEWSVKAIRGEYAVNAHITLVDEIRELLGEFRSAEVNWIRGHTGHRFNEMAHQLALEQARLRVPA